MLLPDDQLKSLILQTKLVTEQGLTEIETYIKNSGESLYDALIEKDVVTDENLGLLIADYLKIPYIVLAKTSIAADIFNLIPERIARREKVIAFERNQNTIKVAMADPKNIEILEMLAKKTQSSIIPHLSTDRDIENALRIYRKNLQNTFNEMLKDQITTTLATNTSEKAPITKIVDLLVRYAYEDRVSDVHIEPLERNSLIRFRIDGMLHDVLTLPKELHDRVVTRIKVLSKLRTDEHLSPQDGKMQLRLEQENLDIRVSIVPVVEGEKIVLRLLSSHFRQFSLVDLGMSDDDLKKVSRGYKRTYGMILSTGPTGSGKTTSIYAILKILNTREKNITTIEDPVEYRIQGVNQIHVNTKTNLTFASGLRSILRQDPNIVFVGEIRDGETAGIAVNAALTGHLVLSTLHTNDAATTLPRLTDMKVEPFLVASTVNIIIGQRLIRKICEMCKTTIVIQQYDLAQNIPVETIIKAFGQEKELRVYQGIGCKVCHKTGYMGRIGVYEVLVVSSAIRKLITEKQDSDIITKQAIKEGMNTMLDDGLLKVAKGITTVEEVLRVTKVEGL